MPEEITEVKKRFGYFPRQFTWQDRRYVVDAVERCWTVSQRQDGVERLCFQVRCEDGRFELFHDLTTDTWYIETT